MDEERDSKPSSLTPKDISTMKGHSENGTQDNHASGVCDDSKLPPARMSSTNSVASTSKLCLPTGGVAVQKKLAPSQVSIGEAIKDLDNQKRAAIPQQPADKDYSKDVTNYWVGEFQRRSISRSDLNSSEFLMVESLEDCSSPLALMPDMKPPAAALEKKVNIRAGLPATTKAPAAGQLDLEQGNKQESMKAEKMGTGVSLPMEAAEGMDAPRPGAYALPGMNSEESISERRRSLLPEVRDSLGQVEIEEPEENETSEKLEATTLTHRQTSSSAFASSRTTATEARDSDQSGSGPFVAKANMVDDAETIFYAEDVQHDNSKKLVFFAIFLSICAAAIVTTVVLLTRDDPGDVCIGDPLCCLPLEEQNTLVRCSCTNSTSEQYDNMADDRKQLYEDILEVQKMSPFWWEYGSDDWDRNSCSPLNQIILFGTDTDDSLVEYLETAPLEVQLAVNVLLIVYVTMDGIHWTENRGWGATNAPCDWFGVGCLFVDVWHELKLPSNGLSGAIPSALQYAFEMRELDFSQNNISGTIPSEIGRMRKLGSLYLGDLQLTGSIPESLASLPRLGILDLHLNQLTGTIPAGVFQMPVLRELEVGSNSLEGSLPNATYSAPQLAILRVNNNQLTGTLPEQMEGLEALELLNVGENSLSGTIPEFLGKMKGLQFINLYNSGLSGSVPESFCEISNFLSRRMIVDCRIIELCSCCVANPRESIPFSTVAVECGETMPEFTQGFEY